MTEHDELRASVRRFFSERGSPRGNVPDADAGPGYLTEASRLGLFGLLIPPADGGQGAALTHAVTVLEEIGSALAEGPFLSSIVAGAALSAAPPGTAVRGLRQGLADGSAPVAVAIAPRSLPEANRLPCSTDATGSTITGSARAVLDAPPARHVLVPARAPDSSLALFAVTVDASGVDLELVTGVDPSRRASTIAFHATPAVSLVEGADAQFVCDRMVDAYRIALAAEAIGMAGKCLDLAVGYAQHREAFGRPIGSFQAIKHQLADRSTERELARALTRSAAAAWDAGEPSGTLAALAAAAAAESAMRSARGCVLVHGAIGFTWEHDAHRYLARAMWTAAHLGGVHGLRARAADLLLAPALTQRR